MGDRSTPLRRNWARAFRTARGSEGVTETTMIDREISVASRRSGGGGA
ncbi:MAG: hypothetical protein M3441_23360 [Chloroflexota bacterium]|nr:hypothetical protein [Chloroflexota bacterium]